MTKKKEENDITHFTIVVNFRDGNVAEFQNVLRFEINPPARVLIVCTAEKTRVFPVELIKDYEFWAFRRSQT